NLVVEEVDHRRALDPRVVAADAVLHEEGLDLREADLLAAAHADQAPLGVHPDLSPGVDRHVVTGAGDLRDVEEAGPVTSQQMLSRKHMDATRSVIHRADGKGRALAVEEGGD